MKFPSLKAGGKKKTKKEDSTEEKSSGKKPSKGGKKFRLKGFGFVLSVLVFASVAMGAVAYAYIHFTGGVGIVFDKTKKDEPADAVKTEGTKTSTGDETLDTLINMYELHNDQAGKIEVLEKENTELVKKTDELETEVEVFKTEIEKIEPGKVLEIQEMVKKQAEEEAAALVKEAENPPPKPKTFEEPEGGWETNEKLAEKLTTGDVESVESWNEKYGGWLCVGTDDKRYLVIPSGTAIEATKLGL